LKIEVVNPVNSEVSVIAVDYNNLPIRCRHCLATSHLVRDCAVLTGREQKEGGNVEGSSQEVKNKGKESVVTRTNTGQAAPAEARKVGATEEKDQQEKSGTQGGTKDNVGPTPPLGTKVLKEKGVV
jgi:hypothetical protein